MTEADLRDFAGKVAIVTGGRVGGRLCGRPRFRPLWRAGGDRRPERAGRLPVPRRRIEEASGGRF